MSNLDYGRMFNSALEQACFEHLAVIEEAAKLVEEMQLAGLERRHIDKVLIQEGFTETQIIDTYKIHTELCDKGWYNLEDDYRWESAAELYEAAG